MVPEPTIEIPATITMSTSAVCPRRSHDLRCRSNRYNYDLSIKQTYDKHATRKSDEEMAIVINLPSQPNVFSLIYTRDHFCE
jgi:hypothetical protein